MLGVRAVSLPSLPRPAGSVETQKVWHLLRAYHPELVHRVVGTRNARWLAFLRRHGDRFVVFQRPPSGQQRMRLVGQADWWVADRAAEQARITYERSVAALVVAFVKTFRRPPTLDDFIAAHADVEGLPARGDLVRLLYRQRRTVWFDRETFQLILP